MKHLSQLKKLQYEAVKKINIVLTKLHSISKQG